METPETEALFAELFARCAIVEELNGPQVEAFVSGLVPMFDEQGATVAGFVSYCAKQPGEVSGLVCAALAELFQGDDPKFAGIAAAAAEELLVDSRESLAFKQVGASVCTGAWTVSAPFGRSIMLGFGNPIGAREATEILDSDYDDSAGDARHSVLVEVDENGQMTDLQLSGAAEAMVDDAGSVDDRVVVEPVELEAGLASIIAAWPAADALTESQGPGIAANDQFVRHRVWKSTGTLLPKITLVAPSIDVQRGLSEEEFVQANQAALSTLRAALGSAVESQSQDGDAGRAWVGVVRGDGGELSGRERDALLWLEWADWLGACIGLARAGEAAEVTGAGLVDYVNRCPEVSSSIGKTDRDYAEWAFSIAIDVLEDAGAVADRRLTEAGLAALVPALVEVWS